MRAQKGGSTSFKFTYTFDADDALAGKMSFMAMARIVGHFDALPGDNQFTSAVVKVTR